MSQPDPHRSLAARLAARATPAQREALVRWLNRLAEIRSSAESAANKGRLAVQETMRAEVILPLVKDLGAEVKRLGWDERGTKSRFGIVGAGLALAAFGTQGVGIAALGTAIGVPLWLVVGSGAYFIPVLLEELQQHMRGDDAPPSDEAPKVREGEGDSPTDPDGRPRDE